MPVTIRRNSEQVARTGRRPSARRSGQGEELLTVTVDAKSRLLIPSRIREAMGVTPGTVLCIKRVGSQLYLAKVENPFEDLARYAIAEDDAGRSRNLRDYARERNIPV